MRIERVIGQRVAQARKEQGQKVTQMDVAVRMNALIGGSWSPAGVSKVENGHRRITAEELYALSVILNRPVEWFFELPKGERTVEFPGGVWNPQENRIRYPLSRGGAHVLRQSLLKQAQKLQEEQGDEEGA
jgi:transcriptional regulator with XRE-family HTH domain